jgi:transcriptional regulator with XRE-family HTH domain
MLRVNKEVPVEWSLGKRVKIARIERGMSQQQLAKGAGLRQSHLSMIENDRHDPSATIVRDLAQALGVTAGYLLGLTDKMDSETLPIAPAFAASTA